MAIQSVCSIPRIIQPTDSKVAVVLRILQLMHEALRAGVVLSKRLVSIQDDGFMADAFRDIFYRDPALFNSQSHVDRYIDDIAFTFSLPRSALNVTAAAKGLISGCVRFCRHDGSIVDAAADRDGLLVPAVRDIHSADMSRVKWVIVVEKEASFRSILASPFWQKIDAEGVVVTAKGYPDVATRALLHLLTRPNSQNGWCKPHVYGLADFDPDGLAILSVYQHGSIAMMHENSHLCTPGLDWRGLRSEHIFLHGPDTHASQGLLHLSMRDRAKGRKMLEWDSVKNTRAARELQCMLVLNIKAELQLLDAVPASMHDFLCSIVEQ